MDRVLNGHRSLVAVERFSNVHSVIDVLIGSLAALVVTATLYHALLVVAGLVLRSRRRRNGTECESPHTQFLILVPAHNESKCIRQTLTALKELDYPVDNYSVFVIADNCSDNTKEVVSSERITCLERVDTQKAGKGHAISWALKTLENHSFDCCVIIDADCIVSKNALTVLDHELARGSKAIQLDYIASNPDSSCFSYLSYLANHLENYYYYYPRSSLKLATHLRGTGMAISRSLLRQIPWSSSSIVEDLDYSIELCLKGVIIKYSTHAHVLSQFPDSSGAFSIQRKRWIGGGIEVSKRRTLGILLHAIKSRNLRLFEAGISTCLQSRSMIVLGGLLLLVVSLANSFFKGTPHHGLWVGVALGVFAAFAIYAFVGVLSAGVTKKRIGFLLMSPVVVVHWLAISVTALLRGTTSLEWQRSPRFND